MTERPILFSAPMVRAILAGTKTQTRRLLRPRHDYFVEDGTAYFEPYVYAVPEPVEVPCPFGEPGDQLWVRETWQPTWASGRDRPPGSLAEPDGWAITYTADNGPIEYHDPDHGLTTRCKPGIHMPRWASRITLEVTDVRVQRLHGITDEDALAEGASNVPSYARDSFAVLWDSINGKRAPWSSNPWVWAVTFKRLS